MKLALFLILLFSFPVSAFRLSRVIDKNGKDILPSAHIKWNKKIVTIGSATYDENYHASSLNCSNIGETKPLVEDIVKLINDIPEADIELKWAEAYENPDITIFSYNSSEWDTYKSSWKISDSTLGLASSNGFCNNLYVCNFTSGTIRLKCETLKNPASEDSHDYKTVLFHEILHTLGLDHTSDTKALMYPGLSKNVTRPKLSKNDEGGIIFLYPSSPGPDFLKVFVCGKTINSEVKYNFFDLSKHFLFLLIFVLLISILKTNTLKKFNQT